MQTESIGSRAMALGAALFIIGLAGALLRAPEPAEKSAAEAALEAKPKTVLFIVIDTLRADHLGCYGGKAAATPNIDALAERGHRFDDAVCPTPLTRPSITSMMTGLYPREHGVRDNDTPPLSDRRTLLAERLRDAGYATGAFVSGQPMDKTSGLARGFDRYDDTLKRGGADGYTPRYRPTYQPSYRAGYGANVRMKERRADATLAAAAEWLEAQGSARAFCWVHLFDPHAPYAPPPPERERYASSPYAGEVAYVDRQLGLFFGVLKRLNRLDDTVIVLTADHGEALGEHGEDTHGHFLYDATMRVPLIIAGPGVARGPRPSFRPPVSLDIAPTICGLVDVEPMRNIDGIDLLAGDRGVARRRSLPEPVYLESFYSTHRYGWAPLRATRYPFAKYIHAPDPELYDLEADPHETHNLAGAPAGSLSDGIAGVTDWSRPASRRATTHPRTGRSGATHTYYGSSLFSPQEVKSGRNPMKAAHLIRLLDQSRRDLGAGRGEKALAGFEALLREDPGNRYAMVYKAHALRHLERYDSALEAYEQVRDLLTDPEPETWLGIGVTLFFMKRYAEAKTQAVKITRQWPDSAEGWSLHGKIAAEQKNHPAAAKHFLESLRHDPSNARRMANAGAALVRSGKLADGVKKLLESLRLSPRDKQVTAVADGAQPIVSKEDVTLGTTLANAIQEANSPEKRR